MDLSRGGVTPQDYAAVMLRLFRQSSQRLGRSRRLFRLVDDVEQPGDLLRGLRCRNVLVVERVLQREIEPLDLADLQSGLGIELVDRLSGDPGRRASCSARRSRPRAGPRRPSRSTRIDAHELAIAARLVFNEFRMAMLTRMVWLASCGLGRARDHGDLAVEDVLQRERRRRPADVDLPGHHLRQRRGYAAGRERFRIDLAWRSSPSRIRLDDEPGEENAMVLPAASFRRPNAALGARLPVELARAGHLRRDPKRRGSPPLT